MQDPIVTYLMNNHEWYMIMTPIDHVRAWIWCIANFTTFLAYFLIPHELQYWWKVAPFKSVSLFAMLFIAFIALCGLSHLVMIVMMPIGPWWAILYVYLPMAIVSMLTVCIMRLHRKLVCEALEAIYQRYMSRD